MTPISNDKIMITMGLKFLTQNLLLIETRSYFLKDWRLFLSGDKWIYGNLQAAIVGVTRQVEIWVNRVFKLVPTAAAPATMTKEISATSNPYSIAVAPRWL
jgi:hypothetical protein